MEKRVGRIESNSPAWKGSTRVMADIEAVFPGGVRGTALIAVAVLLMLVLTHLFLPHWSTRYGAYLVAFTVWMLWFVLAGVNFIGQR